MARKRPHVDPRILDNIFASTENRKNVPPYDIKYMRRTYRVREEVHERMKSIAAENGVGLNDMVRWIFERFTEAYDEGRIELPVEEYVVSYSRLSE